MTPFQKLFYFRKSQAVYSQSFQMFANKTLNLSSSHFNCACSTVRHDFESTVLNKYIYMLTCAVDLRSKHQSRFSEDFGFEDDINSTSFQSL